MTFLVAKNCKVIYEYFKEMLEKVLENVHHQPLECFGRIAQTKWHLVKSKGSPFHLQLIAPSDEYLVIIGKSI